VTPENGGTAAAHGADAVREMHRLAQTPRTTTAALTVVNICAWAHAVSVTVLAIAS
jgi:hypothetical protein